MPRKLKTFVTSVGFFDKAVAAPSMKAALEAWGANKNAFQRGFSEETDDPSIVAATMAKPGVVLKRAVGTKDPFTENPALPTSLPAGKAPQRPKPKPKSDSKQKGKPPQAKKGKPAEVVSLADVRAAKHAAALYEKEEARREKEEAKQEAAWQKERERRDEAVDLAQAKLDAAQKRHDDALGALGREREKLDGREEKENDEWDREKKKLEAAVRRAGD